MTEPKKPPRTTGILSKRDCQNGVLSRNFKFITLPISTASVTVARNRTDAVNRDALDFLAVIRPPMTADTVIDIVETKGTRTFGSGFLEIMIAPSTLKTINESMKIAKPIIAEKR